MPDDDNAGNGNDQPDGQDGSSTDQKSGSVPLERFNEVYGQMKTLERDIQALKDQRSQGGLSDEQQRELQAKQYLEKTTREVLEKLQTEQAEAEAGELKEFDQNVKDVLAVHTDVKRDDFLDFLEKEGDDFASVEAAMRGYKRLNETSKEAADKMKQDILGKPKLPASEGAGQVNANRPEEDKNRSLWEIAADAAKGLKEK